MPRFTLESERLLLRAPEAADAAAIAVHLNDWQVVRNLARPPFPYTEDHAHDFVRRQREHLAEGREYAFVVTIKGEDRAIGACGVHREGPVLELGYWIGRPYWGRGYATEAAGEVLALAFRNLRAEQVQAGWFADNPASGRVLEKLGFRPNGAAERDCAARGQKVLCNLVTMSRAEFGRRRAA